MGILNKLFGWGKRLSEENTTSPTPSKSVRVSELVNKLEKDILHDGDSDITGRSVEAAIDLSKIGKPAIHVLIEALPQTSYAHLALGFIGGERALNVLLNELQSSSWRRVAAASKALGKIGDSRALEPLKQVLTSQLGRSIAEVNQAASYAISEIEKKQRGPGWLSVDRERPFDQVLMFSSQLQELLREHSQREAVIAWWKEFVEVMPNMSFDGLPYPPNEAKGRTWSMLAVIIFYSLNPDVSVMAKSCKEARFCWEQALKYEPGDGYYMSCLKQVS